MNLELPGAAPPVVALGLAAALAWGAADFGGGLASRRTALFGVVLFSQLVGLALALVAAVARGETLPAPIDAAWSAVAAVCGGVGIVGLYRGLAVGRMGVVAPVTGVLGAAVPVIVGIALDGLPAQQVLAGIGLAIVAVILVSRASTDDGPGRPSGLDWALTGGLGIGFFNVAISRVTDGFVFGPLVIVRGVEALLLVAVIAAARQPWRVRPGLVPAVVGIGLLDITANGAFVLAAQAGPLAVAAVLSSLYPVTTVILATVLLRERMGRSHVVGVLVALVAIVLIASGA